MSAKEASQRVERTQQLYAQYGGVLFDRCLRLLGDRQEAEDALQESFVRVLRFLESFKYGEDELPWLFRITTNVCLTTLKKRGRRREDLGDAEPAPVRSGGRSDASAGALDARRLLRRLADELGQSDLELLVSCYVDDMDQGQAAAMLGVSRRTVVRRLAKIRRVVQRKS